MKAGLRALSVALLLFLAATPVMAETGDQSPFQVQRLSQRVLLLTERSSMENNIVAIATAKGLVVVDSTGSPVTAALVRKTIAQELGRSDFAYLINTHHHWDHAHGNQAFADTTIIAFEGCSAAIERSATGITETAAGFTRRRDQARARLEELAADSEEAESTRLEGDFFDRISQGLSQGFTATPPQLTFNDRMTMVLGDVTLKLYYFGRAHSGNDIFIHIPEEDLLLTGDVFLDIGWLPLFAGRPTLDIDRWIEVLQAVLDGEDEVKTVVPAHRKVWSRDKLVLWRDYIVELWDGVKAADTEGLTLADMLERLPLPERCEYLKELGHTEDRLIRFHQRNLTAFWRQLKQSAAVLVEQAIQEQGIAAGVERYRELQSQPAADVYFVETDFNSLGYQLLGSGRIREAIEIFKLNVEAYPESWNVHDSLGEAYKENGDTELALKSYRRSIELNPENRNGIEIIKALARPVSDHPR